MSGGFEPKTLGLRSEANMFVLHSFSEAPAPYSGLELLGRCCVTLGAVDMARGWNSTHTRARPR